MSIHVEISSVKNYLWKNLTIFYLHISLPITMKYTLLLVVTVVFFTVTNAQHRAEPCLTNHVTEELFKNNPAQAEVQKNNFYTGLDAYRQNNNGFSKKSGAKKIIPVVFHVIHMYGEENISKAQILDQLRVINEDFSRTNPDKGNTRSIFAADAADCEIEFRLATKDPQGNCTDGITRTYSTLTVETRNEVKNLIKWDNTKYLNIWVVKSIRPLTEDQTGTTLGFAYLPWSLPNTQDGIVVRADYVGTIGTSSAAKGGRTLTHEIGHYLGLSHPFDNGCGSTNCSTSGDRICDTPPVADPSFGCDKNRNSCSNDSPNELDMVENYMDYADGSCQNMFTWGQKAVMDFVMANQRATLVSSTNLTNTGTAIISSPLCAPVADFVSVTRTVCAGNPISFADVSWNGKVASRIWTFTGATPSTSTDSVVTITYTAAGNYDVTLSVTNAAGNNQVKRTQIVVVQPSTALKATPLMEGFENSTFPPQNWSLTPSITNKNLERTVIASASGSASVRAVITSTTATDETFTITMPPVDISKLTGADNVLRFKTAYAMRTGVTSDRLRIFYSTDCGNNFTLLSQRQGSLLTSASNFDGTSFIPSGPSQWKETSLSLSAINTGRTNTIFRFEALSSGGNNIYIDDINLGANPNSVQNYTKQQLGLTIFPNPASSAAELSFETPTDADINISIYDITGKLVKDFGKTNAPAGSFSYTINKVDNNLTDGVYFVKVLINNSLYTEKLVIVK